MRTEADRQERQRGQTAGMFVFGKLVHFLVSPFNLLIALTITGLLLRWIGAKQPWIRRLGAVSLGAAGAWLTLIVLTPFGGMLGYGLETRIERRPLNLDEVAGVIVLGGATADGRLVEDHGTYAINDAAERLTALIAIRRLRPDMPVIVSGGSGLLFPGKTREADITRAFLGEQGVDPSTIMFETDSRNTFENAVFTADILGELESPSERPWLLVTSAFHMPRALGCFRQAGLEVAPYPVDYRILKPSWALRAPFDRLDDMELAVREIVGLVTYRILGRTDALFPDD